MGIVALHAIPNRRTVHNALDVGGIFIRVAGQTKAGGCSRDQLHACDVLVHADFMTTGAPHGDRCMDRLALGFFDMALEALRRSGVCIERNWMRPSEQGKGANENCEKQLE